MDNVMSRSPQPQAQRSNKVFLGGLNIRFDSVCRKFHHSLFPLGFLQPENCSHTNTSVTKIGQTCLLDPAVYQKPYLFVYLYIITSTPGSAVCNNTVSLFNSIINILSFWGCCDFSSREHSPSYFCVHSLPFYFLTAPARKDRVEV